MSRHAPNGTSDPKGTSGTTGVTIARVAGLVLLILGFIPFASFLKVGLEMPGLAAQLRSGAPGRC